MSHCAAVVVLAASLVAAGATGCGDDATSVRRGLTLRIFNADSTDSEGFPPSVEDAIIDVRVHVYQNGRERTDLYPPGQIAFTFDFLEPSGRLPTLEFGENYQIIVEGVDRDGAPVADGATPVFDFFEDSSFREIQIFVSPLFSTELASALYVTGSGLQAAPSEFEGPFVAAELGLSGEALGGQRAGHTATVLPDGRVLVAGGARMTNGEGLAGTPMAHLIDTIEIYDPFTGYWSLMRDLEGDLMETPSGDLVDGPLRLSQPRAFHTATLMDDGRVIVVGGFTYDEQNGMAASSAVEIIDPVKGTLEVLPVGVSDLLEARALHTANWFDGRLYVAGGVGRFYDSPRYLTSVEVYDPEIGFFERALDSRTGSDVVLNVERALHTATNLVDGILVAGGRSSNGALASMEFLTRSDDGSGIHNFFDSGAALPALTQARFGHETVLLERDFENSTAEEPLIYLAVAGGYTSVAEGNDLLSGAGLTGSVEFINEQTFAPVPTLALTLDTPRAHFGMVETSITRDLMILGGVSPEGVTTAAERLLRTADGGFPMTRQSFATLELPRAYAPTVQLPTHNVMVVGGWAGNGNAATCGTTVLTSGCTSELANPGDLFSLGYLYGAP